MAGNIRVLVADDSSSVRAALMKGLSADPGIEVVGYACDGVEAVEQVKALRPDVLTLDVEMPRMDGLRALEEIMKERPTPVVMVSSLTGKGTAATIKALELGAVDFCSQDSATRIGRRPRIDRGAAEENPRGGHGERRGPGTTG